jgi:hypothetical protein
VYRCEHPGCGKIFRRREALHTHWGWHKRRDGVPSPAMLEGRDKLDADGNPAPKRVVPPSLTAQGRLRVNDKIEPPGEWRPTGRLTYLYKWMVDELPPPKKWVRPAHAA